MTKVEPLTERPIPALESEQLNYFTPESMHVEESGSFDPAAAAKKLEEKERSFVLGADFGGDKGTSLLFKIVNGKLIPVNGYDDRVQGNDGKGYTASLKRTAHYAEEHDIPMGISWGGPLNGTKLLFHPKAKLFMQEMNEQFDGDLCSISPNIKVVINDGPAGLMSGAVEAYGQFKAKTVLFIINGGGIGLAVLKDGVMYATEAGHIQGIDALNTYGQTAACGVYESEYVCLERLGANKAGIEAQWEAATGSYMRAKDIEDRYKEGDTFAGDLYDHSALVIAHILQGTALSLDIDLTSSETAIVAHGGAFKFPDYGNRVIQILEKANDGTIQFIMTKDYSHQESNACLDGAALAALVT